MIFISDVSGNIVCWSSAGAEGFKGSRKGTPFAAQTAAASVAKKAMDMGVTSVEVFVNGPGGGREAAGPVARQLIERMELLGYFVTRRAKKHATRLPRNRE